MTIKSGKMESPAVAALYSGDMPIILFGEGSVIYGDNEFAATQYGALDGVICPNSGNLIFLGDFGFIGRMNNKGEINEIKNLNDFADKLAINNKRNLLAINCSRKVFVLDLKTNEIIFEFTPPKAPNCLGFDMKGENLCVGHGEGLTIFDLKTKESPIEYKANGGVYATSFSPDLTYIIAATGEPSLVGWRLKDGKAFRMAGYPVKPNSVTWLDGGKGLATSGGPVLVVWPFVGENGPMGQNADTFGTRNSIVNCISGNSNMIAVGYIDGGVDMVDLKLREFHHVGGPIPDPNAQMDPRIGSDRINHIAMSKSGRACAWGSESGDWGIAKYG